MSSYATDHETDKLSMRWGEIQSDRLNVDATLNRWSKDKNNFKISSYDGRVSTAGREPDKSVEAGHDGLITKRARPR